jgi:hypothetical protein
MASGDAPRRTPQPAAPAGPAGVSGLVRRLPSSCCVFLPHLGTRSGATWAPVPVAPATVRLDLHDASRRKAADSGGRSSKGTFGAGCSRLPPLHRLDKEGARTREDRALHGDSHVFQTSWAT